MLEDLVPPETRGELEGLRVVQLDHLPIRGPRHEGLGQLGQDEPASG